MTKHFAVQHANGHREEFTRAQWAAARHVQNYDGTSFFIRGSEVPAESYYSECESLAAKWLEKKEQTHKKVRVLYGSSAACYVTKWVKK